MQMTGPERTGRDVFDFLMEALVDRLPRYEKFRRDFRTAVRDGVADGVERVLTRTNHGPDLLSRLVREGVSDAVYRLERDRWLREHPEDRKQS